MQEGQKEYEDAIFDAQARIYANMNQLKSIKQSIDRNKKIRDKSINKLRDKYGVEGDSWDEISANAEKRFIEFKKEYEETHPWARSPWKGYA